MKRLGRSVLGGLGGVLWGAGTAVLIQQYGIWPLDPILAYGAPLAAMSLSGWWGHRGRRRARMATAALAVVLIPATQFALQQPTCEVRIATSTGETSLAQTSPTAPFDVDPDVNRWIDVSVTAPEGGTGRIWIEFGGIPVFVYTDTVRGEMARTFELEDNGYIDLGGAPGIYHIGGEIDGVCSGDGYVRLAGDPLAGPVGRGAAAAVIFGLALTWIAGGVGSTGSPSRDRLRRNGRPVRIDGVEIRSPGLEGEAEVHEPTDVVLRTVAGWTEETRQALLRHHMDTTSIVQLTNTAEVRTPIGKAIVDYLGEAVFEVALPNPGHGYGQVVLSSDESGVMRWHLPTLDAGGIDTIRAGPDCTYRIPRRIGPAETPGRRRGLAAAVGAKVLSSLVFPLLDPVFEQVGQQFARTWESKRRPYRFRTFTPAGFDQDAGTEPDWDALARGRALLFVHGTFSRAHTGFGGLSPEFVADLHTLYNGRVFAFDHFTLSDDPKRNIEWFLEHLPPRMKLELDVVCHSRGGLVSRVLAEQQEEFANNGRNVDVRKIVFAASPNAGTILAEPAYLGELVDSYTNLLNFVPGDHIVDTLEGVITAVKHIAVGAVGGLPGLQAMRPGGPFLRQLNRPAANDAKYYAIAGDYEPAEAGWRRYAANRLMDRIFAEPNDLVVPTIGTYNANGSNRFPIEQRREFESDDGIDHTGYFASKQTRGDLLDWLRQE